MKFDVIDLVLGIGMLAVIAGFLMGKATMEDVLTFAGFIGFKKVPSYLDK